MLRDLSDRLTASILCVCIASIANADLSFETVGGTVVSYSERGSFAFAALLPGTYAIDGSLKIALESNDATTATWQTNLYSISLDVNSNGVFYENGDAIIESIPFPHILTLHPDFSIPSAWFNFDPEFESEFDPVPRLITATDGTWVLHGALGATQSDAGAGAGVGAQIASGTFMGMYTSPTSFIVTDGFADGASIGPQLPDGLGTPNLTFNAVLAGDIDRNGAVEFLDFLALADVFGVSCDDCPEDLNSNGSVDLHDFVILVENFGATNVNVSAVAPEPSSSVLLCLGALLSISVKRCHRKRTHEPSRPVRHNNGT